MNKKTTIAVFVSIVVVGVLIGGGLIGGLFTNSSANNNGNQNTLAAANSNGNQNISTTNMQQQQQQTSNQIQSKDTVVGTGDTAIAGKQVTVNYTGVFAATAKKFDSSLDRGVPFTFTLGAGQVIKGWDIGVEGMRVGGKRILVIPPDYGYGGADYGPIPASSTLIFEIELLGVK